MDSLLNEIIIEAKKCKKIMSSATTICVAKEIAKKFNTEASYVYIGNWLEPIENYNDDNQKIDGFRMQDYGEHLTFPTYCKSDDSFTFDVFAKEIDNEYDIIEDTSLDKIEKDYERFIKSENILKGNN